MTSLHDLVDVDSPNWNEIQQLIRSDEDLITRPINQYGRYLLLYACWKKAPLELVIQLINDYPKACEEKDDSGGYVLHEACFRNHSVSVIQLLITKYPKALKEKNYCGRLPLHLSCCCRNISELVIQLLITAYPKACIEKDNYGYLPLHLACRFNTSLSVIQLLVQRWPNTLNETDDTNNKTPLDWAREPDNNKIPNTETISWLENITPDTINRYNIYCWLINYCYYSMYVPTNYPDNKK